MHQAWMCFSPQKGTLFCFCCTLFIQRYENPKSKFTNENRFTNWLKLDLDIHDHKNSLTHQSEILSWIEF